MMILLKEFILMLGIIYGGLGQSSLVWDDSEGMQVGTITLFHRITEKEENIDTNISFDRQFANNPSVLLSIVALSSFSSGLDITIVQKSETITSSYFVHNLQMKQSERKISNLKISYLAIDLLYNPFFYPHHFHINTVNLQTTSNVEVEYYLVSYLSQLANSTYELNVMLSGFTTKCLSSETQIALSSKFLNESHYLIGLKGKNQQLYSIQVSRVLINRTEEEQQSGNYSYMTIIMDVIEHSDDGTVQISSDVKYFNDGLFFGVVGFDTQFDSTKPTIFQPVDPPANLNILYFSFLEKKCSPNQPYFNPSQQLCYQSCSIGSYSASDDTCALCHPSCYSCSGPGNNECTDCLQGSNLQLQGSSCTCLPNTYLNILTSKCETCSTLMLGCVSCDAVNNCIACDSPCSLVGGSCSCPPEYHICAGNEYFCPHELICRCLPQYFNNVGSCEKCDYGCYLCEDSSSSCIQCIDQFILIDRTCIFFSTSTVVIDGSEAIFTNTQRCIAKTPDNFCIQDCDADNFFYRYSCYPHQCPTGTFPIADIQTDNRRCHPCSPACLECQLYYVCDRCVSQFYYRGQTGLCIGCPEGCFYCQSEQLCLQCIEGYFINGSSLCQEVLPALDISCQGGCRQCVLNSFCAVCDNEYFLSYSGGCVACNLPGLSLAPAPPAQASPFRQCRQICGDGYAYNHECDDGNTQSGDGCSQQCKIEQEYTCQYVETLHQSICFKSDYQISVTSERKWGKNTVQITVEGSGISIENIPYTMDCGINAQLLNRTVENKKIIFTIEFSQNCEDVVCKLKVEEAVYLPEEEYSLNSEPKSLYVDYEHPTISAVSHTIQGIGIPMAYIMWIYCVLGIAPYDTWINFQFFILHIVIMYDSNHMPPALYLMLESLQFSVFDYDEEHNYDSFVSSSWKILVFYAVNVLFFEVFLRCLKHFAQCSVFFTHVIDAVMERRLINYVVVSTVYEPLTSYYSFEMFTSSTVTAPTILIACLYLCISIGGLVVILVKRTSSVQIPNHHKYLVFIPLIKTMNILIGVFTSFTNKQIPFTPLLISPYLLLFIGYTLSDRHIALELAPQSGEYYLEKVNMAPGVNFLTFLRKFNLLLQFGCLLCSTICLLLFWADSTHNNHQIYSIIMMVYFVFGSCILGQILNLICTVLVLRIYGHTSTKVNTELQVPVKSEQRFDDKNGKEDVVVEAYSEDNSSY